MVGIEEGNRRLACLQTVRAFDPEATTFWPTMAMYWPAKRERSARIKKSNSTLETFFRRHLGICLSSPLAIHVNRPWAVRQSESRRRKWR